MANIEILKALHGDAFILHCKKDSSKGIVVVDGGPNKDSKKIVEKFDQLCIIDLMILTHYDDDHIGGILKFVREHANDMPFPVKEMWLNCAYDIPMNGSSDISFKQAQKLADNLKKINTNLIANDVQPIIWKSPIIAGMNKSLPFADFTIVSPDEETKTINNQNYSTVVNSNIASSHKRQDEAISTPLNILALNKTVIQPNSKQEIVNLSSIAFVISCDNFQALMLGDCYPQTIIDSLKKLGYSSDNPLKIDYVKVSHHGSRNNISCDMLDMIDCQNYLISTNGGSGASIHPDRETIAKIVCHKSRNINQKLHFYFNYPLKCIEERGYKFINDEEPEKYNFELHDDIQSL
jgi:beta-lactamase superfamily II metal-dependent hydrolase